MSADPLYCAFCGKNQHEVAKMVAGPNVFICDECIDLLHQVIHAEKPPFPPEEGG